MDFLQSCRKLNRLMFVLCICPFMLHQQSHKFKTLPIHIVYSVTVLLFYFIVSTTIYYRIDIEQLWCNWDTEEHKIASILKILRVISNVYGLSGVIIFSLLNCVSHSMYFNQLQQFDLDLMNISNSTINYRQVNSKYLILCCIWIVYYGVIVNSLEYYFFKMDDFERILYFIFYYISAIVIGICIFHIQSCAAYYQIRATELQEMIVIQLEAFVCDERQSNKLEDMLSLLMYLKNVKKTFKMSFEPTLLFILIHDLVNVVLSINFIIFRLIYPNLGVIGADYLLDYIIYELPLVVKDIYCVHVCHKFGNQVSKQI